MNSEQQSGGFIKENILKALGLKSDDLDKVRAILDLIEIVKDNNSQTVIKIKNSNLGITLDK